MNLETTLFWFFIGTAGGVCHLVSNLNLDDLVYSPLDFYESNVMLDNIYFTYPLLVARAEGGLVYQAQLPYSKRTTDIDFKVWTNNPFDFAITWGIQTWGESDLSEGQEKFISLSADYTSSLNWKLQVHSKQSSNSSFLAIKDINYRQCHQDDDIDWIYLVPGAVLLVVIFTVVALAKWLTSQRQARNREMIEM